MTQVNLKRLIKKELVPLVKTLLPLIDGPIQLYDADGQWIIGGEDTVVPQRTEGDRYPIQVSEGMVGWVGGAPQSRAVAVLLSSLTQQLLERKTLAVEVLDRYREINLLYTIAEKLTTCRTLEEVAHLALEEAKRFVTSTSASMMLLNAETQRLERLITLGREDVVEPISCLGEGITGYVAATGKSEIVNDVLADERCRDMQCCTVRSLMCAPLKAMERVIGVISIYHDELVDYTAADLKLLTAIALQSTPAIESALFHAREMAAARQREAALQEQLQELRIEIDEARRARQVAEITETDFFQSLQEKAKQHRKRQEARSLKASPADDYPFS